MHPVPNRLARLERLGKPVNGKLVGQYCSPTDTSATNGWLIIDTYWCYSWEKKKSCLAKHLKREPPSGPGYSWVDPGGETDWRVAEDAARARRTWSNRGRTLRRRRLMRGRRTGGFVKMVIQWWIWLMKIFDVNNMIIYVHRKFCRIIRE